MPQERRLKKKSDFDRVFKEGKKVKSDSFRVYYLHRKDKCGPRFGVVVSKKTESSAAKRNRLKRVFREVLRELLSGIVDLSVDMVFFLSAKSENLEHTQILKEVREVLESQELV